MEWKRILSMRRVNGHVSRGRNAMEEDFLCSSEEKHQGHVCVLRSKGLAKTVKNATDTPNVICLRCDQEANSEKNVCFPMPLFI